MMPREIFPGDNAPPMPKKRMCPCGCGATWEKAVLDLMSGPGALNFDQAAYDLGFASGQASIDDALDAIHERATVVHLGEVEFEQWYAEIYWNIVDYSGFPAKYLGSRKATGYGPTRTAAILDACRKAKEGSNGN